MLAQKRAELVHQADWGNCDAGDGHDVMDGSIGTHTLIITTASELHQAPNIYALSSRRPDKLAPA